MTRSDGQGVLKIQWRSTCTSSVRFFTFTVESCQCVSVENL
jgi:hypothetical protein